MQHPVAHRTAARLRTIREQWGAMLAAIETPPTSSEWPPRETRGFLNTGAAEGELLVADRAPLVLRQHPAPANLDALDTALFVERSVFALADTLAAAVQRASPGDARRWTYQNPGAPDARTAAGSRRHGLHWACVWVEGRVLDEDTDPELDETGRTVPAPFLPLPEHLLHEAARVARQSEQRIARTLDLEQRATPIPDRPCPWCGGDLTLHTGPEQTPTVTCTTGESCPAPVSLDNHERRAWAQEDLLALAEALKTTPQEPSSVSRMHPLGQRRDRIVAPGE
ncbi:hypothetical protein ACFP1Z_09305 [Streptomyces gamaensis]|uniref:LigA protein n=1 Tax=Streptomyces gamaensis TaxID=1763542 RepID=A0ABW0YVY9_9ACTN